MSTLQRVWFLTSAHHVNLDCLDVKFALRRVVTITLTMSEVHVSGRILGVPSKRHETV